MLILEARSEAGSGCRAVRPVTGIGRKPSPPAPQGVAPWTLSPPLQKFKVISQRNGYLLGGKLLPKLAAHVRESMYRSHYAEPSDETFLDRPQRSCHRSHRRVVF
ncbi:hypothetical protein AGR3A_Lc70012 [Agrobacterium tomkonis CFBP 6623]|uniref:Uncharacterized protein n=1 Tax=Agrobacterium tomkonis CFBP 6623 TaxID=1183432 RepID=A0A1S7S660_9HYPH|nr:hypothetical protein AGR3A_Lc70012 [Agrobacterium tomkonis CFBP 6623]